MAVVEACARGRGLAPRHDLTLSARRLGLFEELVVVDALRVLLEMQAWEQTHPAVGQSPAA